MFATSLYTLSSVVRVLGALACADVAKDLFLPCSGASGSSEEVYLGALFQPVLGRANGASLLLSRLHFCAVVRLRRPIVPGVWHRILAKELEALRHVALGPRQQGSMSGLLCNIKDALSGFRQATALLVAVLPQRVVPLKAHMAELASHGRRRDGLPRLLQDIQLRSATVVVMPRQALRRQMVFRFDGVARDVLLQAPAPSS